MESLLSAKDIISQHIILLNKYIILYINEPRLNGVRIVS